MKLSWLCAEVPSPHAPRFYKSPQKEKPVCLARWFFFFLESSDASNNLLSLKLRLQDEIFNFVLCMAEHHRIYGTTWIMYIYEKLKLERLSGDQTLVVT